MRYERSGGAQRVAGPAAAGRYLGTSPGRKRSYFSFVSRLPRVMASRCTGSTRKPGDNTLDGCSRDACAARCCTLHRDRSNSARGQSGITYVSRVRVTKAYGASDGRVAVCKTTAARGRLFGLHIAIFSHDGLRRAGGGEVRDGPPPNFRAHVCAPPRHSEPSQQIPYRGHAT